MCKKVDHFARECPHKLKHNEVQLDHQEALASQKGKEFLASNTHEEGAFVFEARKPSDQPGKDKEGFTKVVSCRARGRGSGRKLVEDLSTTLRSFFLNPLLEPNQEAHVVQESDKRESSSKIPMEVGEVMGEDTIWQLPEPLGVGSGMPSSSRRGEGVLVSVLHDNNLEVLEHAQAC